MQPVEHFDLRIGLKARQRRYPGFENLDSANWTVNATLPRGHESGGPGSTDATDKYESGIPSGRGFDRNLGLTNFILANHRNLFHVDSCNVANPRTMSASSGERNSCAWRGPCAVRCDGRL